MSAPKRYWFPAKRYGWGWGLPVAWQGWAVLAAFAALFVSTSLLFPPRENPSAFVACSVTLVALLVLVCWRTGERPRWRWGGR